MRMGLGAACVLLAVAGCSASTSTQHGSQEEVGADCGADPLPTKPVANTPESIAAQERVEAFIRDYYRAWERAGKPDSTFEAWNAELAKLAAIYMVDDGAFALDEGGLAWPAHHDPEHEKVRS